MQLLAGDAAARAAPRRPRHGSPRPGPDRRHQSTLIVRRLNAGAADRLPELLPDLTELALAPYMGREEAKRLAA